MFKKIKTIVLWCYVVLALVMPLLVYLFPGKPPLSMDMRLMGTTGDQFVFLRLVLGEGVESYELDVLSDMEGRIAGAAADYPDGSNVLVARFAKSQQAAAALQKLKDLIPHQKEVTTLWGTEFGSESGEYIVLSALNDVLVMVIADRKPLAQARFKGLPSITYNERPGLGAVLAQKPKIVIVSLLLVYVLFQGLIIARFLGVWRRKKIESK
ncbi:MAG: hypothetical protein KAS94_01845 [Desulfobulbaceae bacterium]|nr:hypothetical protein [Desulfobulbaceae bacterium]